MISAMDEFIELCKKAKCIYIYGAGKNARSVTIYLKKRDISINGYIVSDMAGNPETLFDLPVKAIRNLNGGQKQFLDALTIVSIGKDSKAYKDVFETICQYGLHNVFFLSKEYLEIMNDEYDTESKNQKIYKLLKGSVYDLGKGISVETYHTILCLKCSEGKEYHWRFQNSLFEKTDEMNLQTLFPNHSALEEFESLYGSYHVLHSLKTGTLAQKKTDAVYMACTHKDKKISCNSFPSWVIPIQVGVALVDQEIQEVRDDQGDNISERNGIYSECTALYWIWKHAPKTDYIGLCHYRRHFDILEEDFVRMRDNDIDVLATSPTFVFEGIGNFFASIIPRTDIDMLLKATAQVQPEYLDIAQIFFRSRFFPPCNLAIMKYDLFQEYAEYVFSITFKIEEFYADMGFYRKDRYMGYLVECLLGIFLMRNKERLKIAYTDMIFFS